MNLISEINESAKTLVETTYYTTKNLGYLLEDGTISIEHINESAQEFLNTYANKIANGELQNQEDEKIVRTKENVINIFAALQALSQEDLADAFNDQQGQPLGQVLSDFYGKNGKEAHKIAANRLSTIGKHPSTRSYRTQADQAVNTPDQITAYANKIRTNIEPVMNTMLSRERQQAQGRLDDKDREEKQANMGRPLIGSVPQRS